MRKIAVTGGKGGTGKSTVAVLKAFQLAKSKKVVLVDLDVECPNDYLITGQKLNEQIGAVKTKFPVLDKNKCQKCGKCAEVCRQKAIFLAPQKYPQFFKELCSACGACWTVCPQKAIKTKKEIIGKIYQNQINKNLWLMTGLAKPLLEETGPVVNKVKKRALNFAKKIGAKIIIFDTAAGTHCPVIAALMDADIAYAVTEPTPLGAHDLRLILELLKRLKIPSEIIINQADLGNREEIKKIAKDFKKSVGLKINYSPKIIKAYSRGKLEEIDLDEVKEK